MWPRRRNVAAMSLKQVFCHTRPRARGRGAYWPAMATLSDFSPSAVDTPLPLLARGDCVYTSQYCEENVWHLLHRLQAPSSPTTPTFATVPSALALYAVFITNPNRQVRAPQRCAAWPVLTRCVRQAMIWCQRAATRSRTSFVVWVRLPDRSPSV
jgi:hypothetical protein